jgi:hypothetical protein
MVAPDASRVGDGQGKASAVLATAADQIWPAAEARTKKVGPNT